MSTLKVDTIRPVTTDADLALQGDASGAGVTGAKVFGDGSLGADSITDLDGTGAPDFTNGWKSEGLDAYACRAWVNFNGTGTVAIRASGNVSSITDNGTGDYTVNFTTAMPDANYSVAGIVQRDNNASSDLNNTIQMISRRQAISSSGVRITTLLFNANADTIYDSLTVSIIVFR